MSTPGVTSVEIRADIRIGDHRQLAYLQKPALSANGLTRWVADHLFRDMNVMRRVLTVDQLGPAIVVGTLTVEFDPQYLAENYMSSISSIIFTILLESLLIGLALLLMTRWLLTAPLKRAANAVAQIGPAVWHSDRLSIPVPGIHDSNELGQLLHHTNQLVERLTKSQIELRQLATRDPLTGMANRMLVKEQLANMMALAKRMSKMVGVIFLDLDRFKAVNDTLGHDIGDHLLKAVADRLLKQVRQQDAVGRLGGDEFLFLVTANDVDDVIVLADRIIDVLAKPYAVAGYEIRTNASLGIAMFPENGEDADTLMRSADLAMYRAKSEGASRWQLYSEDMQEVLDEDLALKTALFGAIDRNELVVHLQPQFHTKSGELAGCEALLRWKHKGNWIAPYEFIKIAESTGLILVIGEWVIGETCRIMNKWATQSISISVNISGLQLGDENFVSQIFATVSKYNIDPGLIKLEITETLLMENLDQCIERLTELRKAGFKISIDDFGTGYSSLAYLVRLPIDELKIDRSFISGPRPSTVILNTIIAMGRALNLQVVAEGVETEEQRSQLIDSGCDFLQGYLLGKPKPAKDFTDEFIWVSDRICENA